MTKYVIERTNHDSTTEREIVEIWPLHVTDPQVEVLDINASAYADTPVRHRPEGLPDRLVNEFGPGSTTPLQGDEASTYDAVKRTLGKNLGIKRLPQVGEVWRNRNGALVAIMSAASVLDGGYNVVTISKSESARNPGHVYVVNLDGFIQRSGYEAGGDLIKFVTRFDG